MINVTYLEKMHTSLQMQVMQSLNRTQIAMRNSPFSAEDWNKFPTDAKHTLLEADQVFSTCLSLVYTRMMAYAEKLKDLEAKRYAIMYIQSEFGRATTSGVKFSLTEQRKQNIRNKINAFWQKPL